MRLLEVVHVKRVNNVFYFYDFSIAAKRISSDGYGVLLVFEAPTQLDHDFRPALGPNKYAFFITAKQYDAIGRALDLSDYMTRDWLRKGKGWGGERPLCDLC